MATPIQKHRSQSVQPVAPAAGAGERSETAPAAGATGCTPPNPEVLDRPVRRTFTAEYKLAVLAECDAASEPGQIGRILRREGLYSSHLSDWRASRDRGALAGLAPRPRGPKPRRPTPEQLELARLTRENTRLQKQLERAELIIDFQKKVSALLGIVLPTDESDESNS